MQRLGAGVGVVVLVSGLVLGCSKSDDSKSSDTTAKSTVTTAGSDSGSTDSADAGDASGGSGDANGSVVVSDGEAPADRTITVSADGFSPDTMEISVGEKVTFVAGSDGDVYSVVVGDIAGMTVMKGIYESFVFPAAGTVNVVEEISETTATITVK